MCDEYFSNSYFEAREKFLEATASLDCESVCLRDDLFIDFAQKKSKNKDVIVFFISGTHGVEGYLGSAAQLLFIKEFLPKLKGVSICFIHALNPFGFVHDRRVNENNVDLNRNAVYDERLLLGIPNTPLSNALSDSLLFLKLNRPRRHRMVELLKYYSLVFKSILKSGVKNTIRVGIGGQSSYPRSVGFKGVKLEDSLLHLRSFIEDKTQGFKKAIFIDIHSGIGRKYELRAFTNISPNSREFLKIKRSLKKTKSRLKSKVISHEGSISHLFQARSHASVNIDLTIEYGTVPKVSSRLALDYLAKLNIAENQVFFFGSDKLREKIRRKYKKAYSPMDKTFRKSLVRKTRKFYRKFSFEFLENY